VAGQHDITALLIEWGHGKREALDELTPLVYRELRQLAKRQLRRERPGHTLQSTGLVHEAYLKLVDQKRAEWRDREHFFAVAAQVMRHILVSHARARGALKRGAGQTLLAFDEAVGLPGWRDVDLIALDDALNALLQLDPQKGRIVELRFFSGLSIESTAKIVGISAATVKREWNLARAWLHRELGNRKATDGA
jgi:RNA polymerase sigma factor (TIGR02999 family)